MAYSLTDRFPAPKNLDQCIFGPAAYQNQMSVLIPKNKAPFNSKTSRDAGVFKPYTDQLYLPNRKSDIPNCTAFLSKKPRFPYEALSKEDIENLICRCSMECECPLEGETVQPKEEVCQKRVPRKLIVGRPPRYIVNGGKPCYSEIEEEQERPRGQPEPPFYNTKVFEATTFYHGWKWSQRTAKRFETNNRNLEVRPGPCTYTLDKEPRDDVICDEKIRFLCRKASKQPRLSEILENNEIRRGGPGPTAYYPQTVDHNAVSVVGSRADRFETSKLNITPGPSDYTLKRLFDLPEPPINETLFRFPEPSFFGSKAPRFKSPKQIGPGPAAYVAKGNPCKIQHCVESAPFGSSAPRFKTPKIYDDSDDEDDDEECDEETAKEQCKQLSWMFRSTSQRGEKTRRPVETRLIDIPPERKIVKTKVYDQHLAPFQSSEGRFLPWNDWMSVYGRIVTPGPGAYSLAKPKCYHPAVVHGPLYRASKTLFYHIHEGPAPNVRNTSQGLDIKTFNLRLQKNQSIRAQSFKWVPPKEPRKLTLKEKESLILRKSIELLDDTSILQCDSSKSNLSTTNIQPSTSPEKSNSDLNVKKKILRCFIDGHKHCL